MTRTRWFPVAAVVVVVALVVAVVVVLMREEGTKSGTAYFPQTVDLYPGDDVRMLGVKIGKITAIQPQDDQVRVDFSYDADTPVPARATAAIISPSLVGVRYVQVGPAYKGGPTLSDGAVIPLARTAAPAEWDQIKQQVQRLAADLGPHANADRGALTRLLQTTSANIGDQGPQIRQTLDSLSHAVTTLADGRTDLFATIRNLEVFIAAIKDADGQVARFQSQLAAVSGVLNDNDQYLARALGTLNTQIPVIQKFISDNKDRLTTDVGLLTKVSSNLANNRQALADVLQRVPSAVSNFANMIDENSGSVTAALAPTNARDPAALVCDAAADVAPGGPADPTAANACRTGLGPLLDLARLDTVPVGTTPVTRNGNQPVVPPLSAPARGGH